MDTESQTRQSRMQVPLWVALAGMVVAFILAIIIMASVLEPLNNLIFPAQPEPPLPPDSRLLETVDNPATSNGEWLYGSPLEGCTVAQFFLEQGGQCQLAPFSCQSDAEGGLRAHELSSGLSGIGTCIKTIPSVANSYSWEVIIARSNTDDYATVFRIYLYKERS